MIRASRGEFIARMDADDICFPDRFEKQLKFLRRHSDVHLCGTAARTFGERKTFYRFPSDHEMIRSMLLFQPSLIHPSVMWRKEVFQANDLYYQESPPTAEDYELWVRGAEKVRFSNMREPLLYYRIDPGLKDGPYVQQQKSGDVAIKGLLLQRLGLEADQSTMWIHQCFSGNRFFDTDSPSVEEFEAWITKLTAANLRSRVYHPASFRSLLQEKYYWLLSGLPKLGFSRLSRFKKNFPKSGRFGLSVLARLALKSVTSRADLRPS